MEKLEVLCTADGKVKLGSSCGKQYGGPSKNENQNYCVTEHFQFWVDTPKICKQGHKELFGMLQFIATLFTISKR